MSTTSYSIYLTDGVLLGEVSDVSITNTVADTSQTSINLIRRGATGFSEAVSESMVHMLENFSNASPPSSPLTGQLWYNSATNTLEIYNGSQFSSVNNGGLATGLASPVTISLVDSATNVLLGSGSFNGSTNTTIPVTLSPTGVIAGTYTAPTITIGTDGRISSADSTGTGLGAAAIIAALGYTPANDALVVHKAGDTMTGTLNVTDGANINVQDNGYLEQNGDPIIPSGCILMWTGTSAPPGWVLCDGTNGSPDLSGSFIVAPGGANGYTVGQTGGADFVSTSTGSAGGHNHTMDIQGSHDHGGSDGALALTTAQLPSHTHNQQYYDGNGQTQDWPSSTTSYPASSTYADSSNRGLRNSIGGSYDAYSIQAAGSGATHQHDISVDGSHQHNNTPIGDHFHNVSIDNRPVFYSLAYIMKL